MDVGLVMGYLCHPHHQMGLLQSALHGITCEGHMKTSAGAQCSLLLTSRCFQCGACHTSSADCTGFWVLPKCNSRSCFLTYFIKGLYGLSPVHLAMASLLVLLHNNWLGCLTCHSLLQSSVSHWWMIISDIHFPLLVWEYQKLLSFSGKTYLFSQAFSERLN